MQIVLFLQMWPEQSSTLPPRDRRVLKSWKTDLNEREGGSAPGLGQATREQPAEDVLIPLHNLGNAMPKLAVEAVERVDRRLEVGAVALPCRVVGLPHGVHVKGRLRLVGCVGDIKREGSK